MSVLLIPEIRGLHCSDLDYGASPADPTNCALYIEAEIGAKGQDGADIFGFTAITRKAIAADQETRWGRGYLVLSYFRWEDVERALQRLLAHCTGTSWQQISEQLNKELLWEFDNYKP
jgi:hypothetical protein